MKYVGLDIEYDIERKGKAILVGFHSSEDSSFEICFIKKTSDCHDLTNIHCKHGHGLFVSQRNIKKVYPMCKKPEELYGEPKIDISKLIKMTAREKNEKQREKLKQILKLLL